jgi:hypothetical protein
MSLVDILRPSAAPQTHEALPRRTHRMEDDGKKKRLVAIAAAAEKQPSAAQQGQSLPSRILEVLKRQQPLTRGELLERLECDPSHIEHALAGLARHDKVYGIRGEGYRLGARPADESQSSQENNTMKQKDSFEKIETLLKDSEKWFAPVDVAKEIGSSRASTVIRLAMLAKQKKIQAMGARRSLRYAALGVAKPSPADLASTITPSNERKPAKTKRRAGAKGAGQAARARKRRRRALRPRSSSMTPAGSPW